MKISAFSKTYQNKTVLDLPDFELEEGQVTAVIGANGSGKSTMAKVLSGIVKTDSGAAALDAVKPETGSKYRIGYMPQKSMAFRMNVEKNILLNGTSREKAAELMEKLNLSDLARTNAKKLSGGETAKVSLARILMGEYDLLILDEPTASMDMESTLTAERLMREYCLKNRCAMLLITHNLKQAERMADRVIYLKKGKLVEYGPTAQMFSAPEKGETRQFLEFYGI